MNIKIINYPYKDHQVGDIVDLGEELNKSLISFERATWVTHSPDPIKTAIKNVVEAVTKPQTSVSKKKFLTNPLQTSVQAAKKEIASAGAAKKRASWK